MTPTISEKTKEVNKPATLNLTVTLADTTYVLGTLSFNLKGEEFSYHFTYPQDAPDTHFNCDTGEYTSRLEHITWHKNIVHIKRGDDVAVECVNSVQSPLFCKEPVISPLYVESIYFNSEPCVRKSCDFRQWKGSKNQKILSLKASTGFSILFILVPANIDTPSILVGTQFMDIPEKLDFHPCLADLCDMNHRPGRIQLCNGWDFLIVTSPLKCRILSPIPLILGNSYRLPNYRNVPAAITDLLMQANNLTKEDFASIL